MKAYERLLQYVRIASASDEKGAGSPSAPGIWDMARLLEREMREMGLSEVCLDEHCYLYAAIPANMEAEAAVLGFIAHMDVSPASPCEDIRARLVDYDGGDILLSEDKNIVMRVSDFPFLEDYAGKRLIVTDGTTLLGADDKAGIAEILTMAERLLADDSITARQDRDSLHSRRGDRARYGALRPEKASAPTSPIRWTAAASGEIVLRKFQRLRRLMSLSRGVSVHPGTAKNVLINAQLLAMKFYVDAAGGGTSAKIPRGARASSFSTRASGSVESAFQRYILRDHDARRLRAREDMIGEAARRINERYGEGRAEPVITQTYRNMAEVVEKYPFMIDIAKEAVRAAGGEPFIAPIRGGTDGANLSFMGLPCPNLGTASHNHHGRLEFACADDMELVVVTLVKIAEAYASIGKRQR